MGRYQSDDSETPDTDKFKQGISLQQIEQKRRDDEEKKKRSLDAKRMRKLKEKNLPRALQMINRANQQEEEELLQHL